MPREGIRAISVYVDDTQYEIIAEAARKERRSLSNFILAAAMDRAENRHLPDDRPTAGRQKKATAAPSHRQ